MRHTDNDVDRLQLAVSDVAQHASFNSRRLGLKLSRFSNYGESAVSLHENTFGWPPRPWYRTWRSCRHRRWSMSNDVTYGQRRTHEIQHLLSCRQEDKIPLNSCPSQGASWRMISRAISNIKHKLTNIDTHLSENDDVIERRHTNVAETSRYPENEINNKNDNELATVCISHPHTNEIPIIPELTFRIKLFAQSSRPRPVSNKKRRYIKAIYDDVAHSRVLFVAYMQHMTKNMYFSAAPMKRQLHCCSHDNPNLNWETPIKN